MIQEEICPHCNQQITVSCGVRACPQCGGFVRVTPDLDAATLWKLAQESGLVGKLLRGVVG